METTTGIPIIEASERLGLTVDAIRKRIRRGKLQATKGTDGLWYVLLDEPTDQDRGQPEQAKLVQAMENEIRWLRASLEQERSSRVEAERRRDILFATFSEELKQLNATTSQIVEEASTGRWGRFWHWFVTGQRS